jgi:hypothetical protein
MRRRLLFALLLLAVLLLALGDWIADVLRGGSRHLPDPAA